MMTLEQLILNNGIELTPDTVGYLNGVRGVVHEGAEFVLRVQQVTEEGVVCYVRPSGRSGDTVNFKIKGNTIENI